MTTAAVRRKAEDWDEESLATARGKDKRKTVYKFAFFMSLPVLAIAAMFALPW